MNQLPKLNLPFTELKFSRKSDKDYVWDIVRQKHVKLDPEEWVRQQMIHYLINNKSYPMGLMGVEKSLTVNRRNKRTDIVVHDNMGKPKMIVELKGPEIPIDQNVFMQIASYNLSLQVEYLLISNGLEHYCFFLDKEKKVMNSLDEIPNYQDLV